MSELILPSGYDGTLYRSVSAVEKPKDDGTIRIVAMKYNDEVELQPGLYESFAPGSLGRAAAAPHRVKLYGPEHGGPLVGMGTLIEETAEEIVIEAKFAATPSAQEARSLALDGFLESASIEFRAQPNFMKVQRRGENLHVLHERATWTGIALVAQPAYPRSAVLSARDQEAAKVAAAEEARLARLARLEALKSRGI